MSIDYAYFKNKLEEEKAMLEGELGAVGKQNPDNPGDWEAKSGDRDTSQADDNTVADGVEEYESNVAIVNTLETKYQAVLSALDRIKNNTYGRCVVCGKEIETDRLEANPSASTCKEHME